MQRCNHCNETSVFMECRTYEWDITKTRNCDRLFERSPLFTVTEKHISWYYLTVYFDSLKMTEDSFVYTSLNMDRSYMPEVYIQFKFLLNGNVLYESRDLLPAGSSVTFRTSYPMFNSFSRSRKTSILSVKLAEENPRNDDLDLLPVTMTGDYGQLLVDPRTHDLIIKLRKNEALTANQCLVYARVPSLRDMIDKAPTQNKKKVIRLDAESNVVKKVLCYVYSSLFPFSTDDDIWEVMKFSRAFKMKSLEARCTVELLNSLSRANYQLRLLNSWKYNFRIIKVGVLLYMRRNNIDFEKTDICRIATSLVENDGEDSVATSMVDDMDNNLAKSLEIFM